MSRRYPRLGARRERVVGWLLLALLLAVTGLAVSIWRPLAPRVPASGGELSAFSASVLDTVRAYRTPRYVVAALATAASVAVPLVFVVTRWGRRRIAVWAGGGGGALRGGLVALRLSVLSSLAVLPLAVYVGIVHDGRWGFRTRSVGGWFSDWFLRSAGHWLLVSVLVAALLAAMRRWPSSWPYRATVGGTVLVAAFVLLHPLVVQPLFLPTTPLADGPDREAVEEVLARAGASDLDVRIGQASLRSTRVNALVTGLGPTERIVIYDNLLELPREQIAAVVAHELAHHEHADLPRGVALSAAALLAGLLVVHLVTASRSAQAAMGARGPADPRMVAVILAAAAVLELVGTPIGNLVSRRAEAAADARAVELTRDPAHLLATTRVFTVRDLSAPEPPSWIRLLYGSHPTVAERIDYLDGWARQHGVDLPSVTELQEAERDQHHPAIADGPPRQPGGARP
ncbi:M48 family metalloprotease [Egicoccus sp. AB-alg6-2]|uniref:M48 family metalloprotease n=1 Tax=Egicoccus sp. AB-alg6-2 TaxID=3242692 RepID=UPI00359E0C16